MASVAQCVDDGTYEIVESHGESVALKDVLYSEVEIHAGRFGRCGTLVHGRIQPFLDGKRCRYVSVEKG